jgi:hypothetical protein
MHDANFYSEQTDRHFSTQYTTISLLLSANGARTYEEKHTLCQQTFFEKQLYFLTVCPKQANIKECFQFINTLLTF